MSMLTEVQNITQPDPGIIRRWFTDSFFDLIVWLDQTQMIIGFQLCYDKIYNEHSITWKIDEGYLHNRIDDGEVAGQAKMTPILVPDGYFDKHTVAGRFFDESTDMDPAIRQFVYDKILRYH
jgi:hypothetical protein